MEIRIQVIIDNDERTRRDIAHWDRRHSPRRLSDCSSMRQGRFSRPVRRPWSAPRWKPTWPNRQAAPTAVGHTASRVDMQSSCAASSAHFVWAVRASFIAHVREAARPLQVRALAHWSRLFPTERRLYLESKWASRGSSSTRRSDFILGCLAQPGPSGSRPRPVHKNEPRPTPCLLESVVTWPSPWPPPRPWPREARRRSPRHRV